jgi:hypothetical protein
MPARGGSANRRSLAKLAVNPPQTTNPTRSSGIEQTERGDGQHLTDGGTRNPAFERVDAGPWRRHRPDRAGGRRAPAAPNALALDSNRTLYRRGPSVIAKNKIMNA